MNGHSARYTTALAVAAILLAFTVQSYARLALQTIRGVATINADTSTQAPQVAKVEPLRHRLLSAATCWSSSDLLPDTILRKSMNWRSVYNKVANSKT